MVCGWDKQGPSIFYVDSDGRRYPHHLIAVGSGASYAYGVLDGRYQYDMTTEEAYDVARHAIFNAAFRDIGSGGNVTSEFTVHISDSLLATSTILYL